LVKEKTANIETKKQKREQLLEQQRLLALGRWSGFAIPVIYCLFFFIYCLKVNHQTTDSRDQLFRNQDNTCHWLLEENFCKKYQDGICEVTSDWGELSILAQT
jgi:hypothetical protein